MEAPRRGLFLAKNNICIIFNTVIFSKQWVVVKEPEFLITDLEIYLIQVVRIPYKPFRCSVKNEIWCIKFYQNLAFWENNYSKLRWKWVAFSMSHINMTLSLDHCSKPFLIKIIKIAAKAQPDKSLNSCGHPGISWCRKRRPARWHHFALHAGYHIPPSVQWSN